MYRLEKKVPLFQTKTPSFLRMAINTSTTTTNNNNNNNNKKKKKRSNSAQHEETKTDHNSSITCLVQLDDDGNDLGERRSPKLYDHGRRQRNHNGSDTDDKKNHRRKEYFTIDGDDEDSCDEEERSRIALEDDGDKMDLGGSHDNGGGGSGGGIDQDNHPQSNYRSFCAKCFNCICPEFAILRLLLQCDLQTFWKLVPPILVTKAFYSSVIALGLCTLFKVQRQLLPLPSDGLSIITSDNNSPTTETYFFGLYTYTGNVEIGQSLQDQVTLEMQRVETCRFDMRQVDAEAPDRLFLNDTVFNVARGFAITAVALGAISTMGLLVLTASNCCSSHHHPPPNTSNRKWYGLWWSLRWFNRERIRWMLFSSLCLCGVFQSMAFLVFASSVCRDIDERGAMFEYEDRHCLVGEGVGIIFSSCFCWWFTAIALLKMPIGGDDIGGSGSRRGNAENEEFCIEISGGEVNGRPTNGFVVPRDDNGDSLTII